MRSRSPFSSTTMSMRHAHQNSSASSTSSTQAHRDKRPFQPSITSFFARDDRDDYLEQRGSGPVNRHQHHHAREKAFARDSLVPSVPSSVQADLLSVGMRVRKSVPEGYKTHKAAPLPSIQTTLAKGPMGLPNAAAADVLSVKPPREPVPEAFQHQRELLPFCGLHKIGGFAEQPVTNVHLYGGTDQNGDKPVNLFPLPAEAFNQPFSSSDSTNSSISTDSTMVNPANPHKRSWQDEEGQQVQLSSDFLFAIPMKVSEDEVPVSPLSETPTQSFSSLPQAALRPFAQPKTRRPAGRPMEMDAAFLKDSGMEIDLENADGAEGTVVGSPDDFDEAEFLHYGHEVEMGGV